MILIDEWQARSVLNQREATKEQSRQKIVEAAAAQFAANGYEGTSFASIAAAMNRPKSAIGYHLFPSKMDLAVSVIEQQQARWVQMEACVREPAGLGHLITMLLSSCVDALDCPVAAGAIRLSHEFWQTGRPLPRTFKWGPYAKRQFAVARSLPIYDSEVARAADLLLASTFGVMWAQTSVRLPRETERQLRDLWVALCLGIGVSDAQEIVARVKPVEVRIPTSCRSDSAFQGGSCASS